MSITVGRDYNCKIEICRESRIVTLTKYQYNITTDLAKNFGSNSVETTEQQYQDNKKKNIRKSAKKIMTLVKHNCGQYFKANGKKFPPIFLTLTYSDNVQDWDYSNNEFKKFIMRLNYKVYGKKCSDLAYIVVPELQDRGAIHYHILFFNLPYIDKTEVQQLWGLGSTKIERESKFDSFNGESLGKYITKYMTKQFYDKDKNGEYKFYYDRNTWEGKKIFFSSKNLFKPMTFKFTKKELSSIDFVFEGEEHSSKINVIKFDYVDDEILQSMESEYLLSADKINFLIDTLPMLNDSYIKKDFYFNFSNKISHTMLDVGKGFIGFKYDNVDFSFGSFTPVGGGF